MLQHQGGTPPDNVVMFPAARRAQPQRRTTSGRSAADQPAPPRRMPALSGAALNERLMILLCICVSGAAALVSAAHLLHG